MRKVYHAQFQNANNRKLVKSFEDMGDNVYNEKAHPATGFAILKLNLMVRHIFSKWLLCFAKKADIIIIVILLEGWKPHGYGIFSSPLWGVVPASEQSGLCSDAFFKVSSARSLAPPFPIANAALVRDGNPRGDPNCLFQIGDVFGFFIPIEAIL